jgi:hypothetical protein
VDVDVVVRRVGDDVSGDHCFRSGKRAAATGRCRTEALNRVSTITTIPLTQGGRKPVDVSESGVPVRLP